MLNVMDEDMENIFFLRKVYRCRTTPHREFLKRTTKRKIICTKLFENMKAYRSTERHIENRCRGGTMYTPAPSPASQPFKYPSDCRKEDKPKGLID